MIEGFKVSSTLMLIVKSLWPFLKEILLKDKGFRDLIAENVVATFLSGCLLALFALFVYTANLADKNFDEVNRLTQDAGHTAKIVEDQKHTIEVQAEELKKFRERYPTPLAVEPQPVVKPTAPEPTSHTPEPIPVKPDRPPTRPTRPSIKPKDPQGSLKSYVEQRLNKLEQDGK